MPGGEEKRKLSQRLAKQGLCNQWGQTLSPRFHSAVLTQQQVCVQAALMSLINHNRAVLSQEEVLLKLPQQDAICHEFQSSAPVHLAVISHLQVTSLRQSVDHPAAVKVMHDSCCQVSVTIFSASQHA